jgi:hypothetical protein
MAMSCSVLISSSSIIDFISEIKTPKVFLVNL